MEIKIKQNKFINDLDFIDALDAPTSKGTDIKIAQSFVNEIEQELNTASMALKYIKKETEFSNEDFVKLLNQLYDISLDEYQDYYKIFSMALGKNYTPYHRDLIYTYMRRPGKYASFKGEGGWEKIGTTFRIAYSDDFHHKGSRYTKEEIKELVKSGQIILLEEFDDEIPFPESMKQYYEKFEVHRNYQSLSEDNFFYPYIIKYLKQEITTENLLDDIHEYLITLQSRIDEVLMNLENINGLKTECEKELNKNNILTRISKLINEVNEKTPKNNDKQKLYNTLREIILSKEYTMIVKTKDETALEYGIIGRETKKVKFENVSEEDFWEFVYQGIIQINPKANIKFHTINGFGNVHSSVNIDINELVSVFILNNDHKYDKWIEQLKASQKIDLSNPLTRKRKKDK